MRTRERAVLAAIFAALLFAGAPRVAQSDECLSATEAANALRCDEHQAALAATKLCSEASPGSEAGGTVSGSAGERIARAASALPRTARATGSPALHTATPARPLHRHLHRGLAMRHASRGRAAARGERAGAERARAREPSARRAAGPGAARTSGFIGRRLAAGGCAAPRQRDAGREHDVRGTGRERSCAGSRTRGERGPRSAKVSPNRVDSSLRAPHHVPSARALLSNPTAFIPCGPSAPQG